MGGSLFGWALAVYVVAMFGVSLLARRGIETEEDFLVADEKALNLLIRPRAVEEGRIEVRRREGLAPRLFPVASDCSSS